MSSPSYEVGRGREPIVENDVVRERAHTARLAFDALAGELDAAERRCGRGLKAAIESVCVEDLACPAGRLGDVRPALADHPGAGELDAAERRTFIHRTVD